jgi:predicted house-cleaning noncanonical NTP pyrophosphatase (MazG superfamily)
MPPEVCSKGGFYMKITEISFNKLVRDKVPEILKEDGIKTEIYQVSDKQIFKEVLLSKLEEEALEASEADEGHLLEELGDIETVIDAILELKGWSRKQLLAQQTKKDKQVGTFNKKIVLKLTRSKNG